MINQPTSTLLASSVQPAFKNRSAEVSGELHRRNQPAFKPYASDQPVLKKIAGPPVIYVSCPRTSSSLFRPTPAAADLVLAPPLASAPPPLAAARLHVEPPPPRPRARPAPPARASIAKAPPCSTCSAAHAAAPPSLLHAAVTSTAPFTQCSPGARRFA